MKGIEKALKKAESDLRSWYEQGDCDYRETEEYLLGIMEGLRLALSIAKGANG